MKNEEKINLTNKEYELLILLLNNKGKVVTRDNILNEVLGMINKDAVKTMQGSRRIINRFKEQNGTVVCKELKGITDGVVKRECIDCVKDAALFLEDELK